MQYTMSQGVATTGTERVYEGLKYAIVGLAAGLAALIIGNIMYAKYYIPEPASATNSSTNSTIQTASLTSGKTTSGTSTPQQSGPNNGTTAAPSSANTGSIAGTCLCNCPCGTSTSSPVSQGGSSSGTSSGTGQRSTGSTILTVSVPSISTGNTSPLSLKTQPIKVKL